MIKVVKLFVVSVLCGTSMALPSLQPLKSKAVISSLSSEVHVGDYQELPMIEITHNEVTKTATKCVITTPKGYKFEDNKLTYSEPGKYLFTYSADFDGVLISKTIEVISIRRPESMFSTSNAVISRGTFAYNDKLSAAVGSNEYNGIRVTSFDNTTITFDKVLDFSKLTKDDSFIDFIVEPSNPGKYDVGEILITLTDVDDQNNKVYIRYVDGLIGSGANLDMTYAQAYASGQTRAGYDPHFSTYHVGSDYTGTPTSLTLRGLTDQQIASNGGYKNTQLFFDYANSSVYLKTVYTTQESKTIVNDLDSDELYPTNPWTGFKNGKAKLSITTKDVSGTGCTYLVKSILNYDLSKEEFRDEIAPEILVNYGEEDPLNLPLSKLNASYPIFKASVTDNFDDGLNTNVKTFFYEESSSKYVTIQNDGNYFKTANPGKYLVKYIAEDRTGNSATKDVFVYCSTTNENLEIVVPNDPNSYEVYDKITLPSLDSVTINNARGHVSLNRTLVKPDGSTSPLKDSFVPESKGEYKVVYSATDIFGIPTTKTCTYQINNLSHPIIVENIALPKVMIKGFTYNIPEVGCKYPSGEEILDGSTSVLINDEPFSNSSCSVESLNPVKITYIPNNSAANKKEFTINVINPFDDENKLRKLNYFYSESGSFSSSTPVGGACQFEVNDSTVINFANYISSNDLSLAMQLDEASLPNYSALEIMLCDYENPDNKVTFEVYPNGKNLGLKAPGSSKLNLLSCTTNKTFTLNFNSISKTISDSNKNSVCKIQYFDDGREFNGFSSAIYFSFRLRDVADTSKVSVVTINNQTFKSSITGDNVGPQIISKGDFDNALSINSELVIKKSQAFDVLSSVKSLTLSVTRRSDAKVLLNNVDANIDQKVVLDKYGDYDIKYIAKDGNNKTSTLIKTVSCKENEAPVLNVSFTAAESYTLNSTFKLPSFTLTDNSNNARIDVTLYLPQGQGRILQHGELVYGNFTLTSCLNSAKYGNDFVVDDSTFKFTEAGRYILRYFAIDSYGNFTIQEFNLNVE